MKKIEIKETDISEIFTFKRADYEYNRVGEKDGWYLFKMTPLKWEEKYLAYEFVTGVKGKECYVYPVSSKFGLYGFYLCGTAEIIKNKMEDIKSRKGLDIDIEYFKGLVK